MVRMFGCERSRNAHIERKKSKCDYTLPSAPTEEQIAARNAWIEANTPEESIALPQTLKDDDMD